MKKHDNFDLDMDFEVGVAVGDIAHQLPGSRIVEVAGGAAVIGVTREGKPFEIIFSDDSFEAENQGAVA